MESVFGSKVDTYGKQPRSEQCDEGLGSRQQKRDGAKEQEK